MFAKIFSQIFDSTIADDYPTRHFFMDLLVLADSDGVVEMTPKSISCRTRIPLEKVIEFLKILEAPDPKSRSAEEEGRRLVKISDRDWGWMIVNYEKYRNIASEFERRTHGRNRIARFRLKQPDEIGSRKGYVYYARVDSEERIKIGFSANPWARMRDFQTAKPGIRVVATERTTAATELLRHEKFSEFHIDGEWFRFEGELLNFVNSLILNDGNTVATTVVTTAAMQKQKQTDPPNPQNQLGGAQIILHREEMNRIIEKMKLIKDGYGDHQTWSPTDAMEFNRLKARRAELRTILGVTI